MDIGEIVGSIGSIALKGFGHLDYDLHYEVSLGSSFMCRAGIISKSRALLLVHLILFMPIAFVKTLNQSILIKG